MSKNCVIVAGPNGSGKTTFAKAYLETYAYEYVNADDIAFHLNPDQPEKVRIQAGRMSALPVWNNGSETEDMMCLSRILYAGSIAAKRISGRFTKMRQISGILFTTLATIFRKLQLVREIVILSIMKNFSICF